MISQEFRGLDPVDRRFRVRMGDLHAGPRVTPPGSSSQKRAPRVPPSDRESSRISEVMRSMLLILGILLLAIGLHPWQRSWMSKSWPVADGEITHSSLLVTEERQGGWIERQMHQTRIEYLYTFQKRRYRGTRIEFGIGDQLFFAKEFAERIRQRYPVGKSIAVILNPDLPSDAVLESTPSAGGSLIFIVFGMICLAGRYFLALREEWGRVS
ncbi:MAG: DUF3592 domain-containing protein [Magnetococcales bacterium]|nr:DUF3592 domain-containing protein [Magnetococcales bacterium]